MVDKQISSSTTVPSTQRISVATVAPTTAGNVPKPDSNNKWITPENHQQQCEGKLPGKRIQVGDNMTTGDRVVLCASEFAGTAILVFLGCMGCVTEIGGNTTNLEHISLTFGLAVMISVQCFGHVSGSHINPIVTVAAATLGNIPLIQVPIYFTGQLFGAFAGYGLLKLATPVEFMGARYVNNTDGTAKYIAGVCSPVLHPDISPMQGLLVEFLISFFLVLVCCGVWDSRNATKHDSVPIKFGLTIAILAMAAGHYTGANMNPVRSLAPALFNGDWKNHWVYWLGPLGAGFLGALLYRFIFEKEEPPKIENNIPEGIPLNDKP